MGVHVLLFLSQLFVRAPQITTLPSCIFFSPLEWFWSPPSVKCYIPLSIVFQALCSLVVHKQFSIFLRNSSQNNWAYFHIAKKWVNMITWHNCQYIISKYSMNIFLNIHIYMGHPQGLSGKESTCKAGAAGDTGLSLGSERSLGGGRGNILQYCCLENPMDRGAWWATVHRVTKNWTWLKQLSMHADTHIYLKLCRIVYMQIIFSAQFITQT